MINLNLNRAQRVILLVGALALIALLLWPPWYVNHPERGARNISIGHHFALRHFTTTEDTEITHLDYWSVIDSDLLAVQLAGVIGVTILSLLAVRSKQRDSHVE